MNDRATKLLLDKSDIALRLYTIQNIASLAAYYPENKAEAYIMQNTAQHIVEMIDALIKDMDI